MSSKYDNMPITDRHGCTIHRMPPSERAKIFMPFDALKGLRESLQETEDRAEQAGAPTLAPEPFEAAPDEAPDIP